MRRSKNRTPFAIASSLLLLTLLLAGGCTTFDHDWKRAAHQPPTGDLQGRWQGTWASQVNGHTDKLRCVVTIKEDGTYQARFHAKYQKVLSFGYTVPLKVEPIQSAAVMPTIPLVPGYSMPLKVEQTMGAYKFSGQANLGWLAGGLYHYVGHADRTNFFSTYSCQYDHGTFQMTRPAK